MGCFYVLQLPFILVSYIYRMKYMKFSFLLLLTLYLPVGIIDSYIFKSSFHVWFLCLAVIFLFAILLVSLQLCCANVDFCFGVFAGALHTWFAQSICVKKKKKNFSSKTVTVSNVRYFFLLVKRFRYFALRCVQLWRSGFNSDQPQFTQKPLQVSYSVTTYTYILYEEYTIQHIYIVIGKRERKKKFFSKYMVCSCDCLIMQKWFTRLWLFLELVIFRWNNSCATHNEHTNGINLIHISRYSAGHT